MENKDQYTYGGGFTKGAGDGDMTPGKAGMRAIAKGGGLMGFMAGGDVLEPASMDYYKLGGGKGKCCGK
ncbi:MAG: hypothetical protein GKR90_26300 [Pseudomonadales bacterium]|nr:hypothetical protein [Pseudomonadales bacterium]